MDDKRSPDPAEGKVRSGDMGQLIAKQLRSRTSLTITICSWCGREVSIVQTINPATF